MGKLPVIAQKSYGDMDLYKVMYDVTVSNYEIRKWKCSCTDRPKTPFIILCQKSSRFKCTSMVALKS